MLPIFLVVLGYLMGSICSAVIICKACSLPDPRTEGSKNPGATNVLRLAGKQYAALVMAADLLKGTIPVLIAKILDADPATVSFTALAAVVGHMYPIFFGFKGGKGVATAIGSLLGLYFLVGVLVAATWLLVAKFSRYSSLASITSVGLAPLYSLLLIQQLSVFLPIFAIALLILYKHKDNINRLIDGTESKIKLKQNVIEEIMEEEHKPTHRAHQPTPPPEIDIEIETVVITETIVEEPKPTKVGTPPKLKNKPADTSEKKTKKAQKTVPSKPKLKKQKEE
ncbi:glycerol-3-phosphate 1-O-acyltransferase PlsY [Legionella longbeachae]|uniref:Glycerol-3-phosphate acyltransferase n=1 Tax=Legionella longbeachae serogroup 1 (strain NSW150) TaxID=661367 RepID=D3HLG9_LEGLN|nr:acyl-phosphate glycerol 3-phosphate acyltransferase [Legionella longbeachae]EEZ93571.1 putative membrane protein [Legionella longbeachae D-4968]CBJ13289.1 putative membrane protein [Legionella longbeachae NSW150]VEE03794.1 transmembrane protein [Legionella oakridgensis]ARM33563.1 glycerol-3-phosphate 1-O-acyltransferase PlsY [Legionella longbeachae]